MAITVGLGSWADNAYVGVLYPRGVPAQGRLAAYAGIFPRIEVNSSYYATPARVVVAGWAKQTPPAFTFDIKLHRVLSQSPGKAATDGSLLKRLRTNVQPLRRAGKLGVFLLVLSPRFTPERNRLEELDAIVEALHPTKLAVELRHREWVSPGNRSRTLDHFRDRQLVWVGVDMPRIAGADLMPPVDEVTNPQLAYMRLHGRNRRWLTAESAAARHQYQYSARELQEIARRARALAAKAEQVHLVANNHAEDFAPKAALGLQKLLERRHRQRA